MVLMTEKSPIELQNEAAEAADRKLSEVSRRNRLRAVGCLLLGLLILAAILIMVLSPERV